MSRRKLKSRKLKSEEVVAVECDNLLKIAEKIAEKLDISVELAVSVLLLRELVILNKQIQSKLQE